MDGFDITGNIRKSSNFASNVTRDPFQSVSKDVRLNPGPGSYVHDQLIKDKMKALSYQMCHRYQQNPFGTGKSRFEYDRAEEKRQA